MSRNTRDMIRDFNLAFKRPVNESYTPVTVEERILLGKLLLEEAVEYITKGLGCVVSVYQHPTDHDADFFEVDHIEGQQLNSIEIVDGLADVNVVIHFCAHWHGINLDWATEIVNDSNMSKLGPDGEPIINGVTPGYRNGPVHRLTNNVESISPRDEPGYDPSKPIGKILKGPNFYEPGPALGILIATEGNNRG